MTVTVPVPQDVPSAAEPSPPVMRPRIALPIRTERLLLRAVEPGDYAAVAAFRRRPDVARYLNGEPWTDLSGPAQFQDMAARTGLHTPARSLAVVVVHDDGLVGHLGLRPTRSEHDAVCSVGWVFHPMHAGRGFATEAARALLDAVFGAGVHRAEAHVDPRNTPSVRLCERLGMTREAHFRKDWWNKGEWADSYVYGLLAADRAAVPGNSRESRGTPGAGHPLQQQEN